MNATIGVKITLTIVCVASLSIYLSREIYSSIILANYMIYDFMIINIKFKNDINYQKENGLDSWWWSLSLIVDGHKWLKLDR